MAVQNNLRHPVASSGPITANPQGPTPPIVASPIGVRRVLTGDSGPWVPQRGLAPLEPILSGNRFQHIYKAITPKPVTGKPVILATLTGVPQSVFNVSVAQSPLKVQNKTVSQITVTFSRNFADKVYDHVNIWVKGYQGNSNWVEYASSTDSPANFFLEANGNTVQVGLQSVSATNQISAPIQFCPMATVTLSGVVSNPPAPTITQTLVAIPLGYQFTFTQVQLAAGTQDVLKSYKVYRNSSNTFAGATVIQTIPDDGKNDGAPIVVQDQQTGGSVFYYFVTAVNTAGLESASSSAQAGLINSGLVNSRSTSQAINSSITTSAGSVLTQHLTSTQIDVASFTVQYPFGQISYNSGSVDPGSYGSFVVYFSDPNFVGGAVAYLATGTAYQANSNDSYVGIGSITTSGGGGGHGGGGGGSGQVCFLPNVKLKDGREIGKIKDRDLVWNKAGVRPVKHVIRSQYTGEIYHMGEDEWVTQNHPFLVGNLLRKASELWDEHKFYEGPVVNLEIQTEKEEEKNFYLANGMLSHNYIMFC